MLGALIDFGIIPDLVVGTSIGSINGAMIAADPSARSVEALTELWTTLDHWGCLGLGLFQGDHSPDRGPT
nr:patatin-like phospholipase family protein [Candidatus Microthrix sp.]